MIKHLTPEIDRGPWRAGAWRRKTETERRGSDGGKEKDAEEVKGQGESRMRQAERPGYSSPKLFLLSAPLFLSRKPTASPYKLPFVPLISPWPLVRTYLIRINARAA